MSEEIKEVKKAKPLDNEELQTIAAFLTKTPTVNFQESEVRRNLLIRIQSIVEGK